MRPFAEAEAIRAIQISTRFPQVHGAPVHIGIPSLIGKSSLDKPDFADSTTVKDNEVPLFWACGVTPHVALKSAKLLFSNTHSAGCMLVTVARNSKLAKL